MLRSIADEWCITKYIKCVGCPRINRTKAILTTEIKVKAHRCREAAVFWDIKGFELVSMCKYVGGYKQRSTFEWTDGHSNCLAEDWRVIFWKWVNHNAHIEPIIPFSMVQITSTAFPLHSEVQNLVWLFLRWLPAHLFQHPSSNCSYGRFSQRTHKLKLSSFSPAWRPFFS